MDLKRPNKLRLSGKSGADQAPPEDAGGGLRAPGPPVNEVAELVADLIEATGLVSVDRLSAVRGRVKQGGSFSQAIIDEGVATSEGLARTLASRFQLPFIDLPLTGISEAAVREIPTHVLERVVAVPYALEGNTLQIAIADPSNVHAIDELRLATRFTLELGVAAREDIENEIKRLMRASQAASAVLDDEGLLGEGVEEEDGDDLEVEDGISDVPLVRLVNSIIFQAAEDGASDIHFEPQEDSLVVRLRIDGVLHEVQRIPRRMMAGVTTRLKVLAKLDIAERRKPQDGRISLNAAAAGRMLDIRVATLPTVEGESVVMRLLDKSKRAPTLQELGLSDEMRVKMEGLIRRPTGAILVTGPTGSGKSTTLYAALTEINRPEINIITVEDPVEFRLGGVNQVQINARAGMTFAAALRSILRSDPDVVMVGEIRDGETAKISIEAALTGHLVLSTLHTNDAPGALTRLNEMGVEPFLTGSAVSAVLAQRLGRKLCTHCCEMYTPSTDEMIKARVSPDVAAAADGVIFYRKKGCPRCGQTGYKGRIGIYQLLVMSENLESLAASKASREELERAAIEEGMRTLWDDGLAKVASGLTSLEELARVTV
ncbi:MAG TPA: ATPase, T2SS/T4P/T4SS family [Gaiellaceae bacterium]|jgi:type IV pilus assembly protein PilB|nr:ATPase, T2SS/T4P/T4SS family [Gaiellaceae bacterium]